MVIEAASAEAVRGLLARVREASEDLLPAVLVLPEAAAWLRGVLPRALQPCIAIAAVDAIDGLAVVLARVGGQVAAAGGERAEARWIGLEWIADRRQVLGPDGSAQLTSSEAQIFAVLLAADGHMAGHEVLMHVLWGDVILDSHVRAGIRSHVYTLRQKLDLIGLIGRLVSLPGAGYRFDPAPERGH